MRSLSIQFPTVFPRASAGRWIARGVRAGTSCCLIAHFTLTLLYNLPLTPLKMVSQPILEATVGTYFQQNWSFFAPDPIAANYSFLVRPLKAGETARQPRIGPVSAQSLPSDGWYDITSPLREQFQKHRFSAYERLARPQSNAMRQYLGLPDLAPWMDACASGDQAACKFYENQLRLARSRATALLARIASAFCNETFPDRDVLSVALRIRQRPVAAWSQRHVKKSVTKEADVDLGVFGIDRNVSGSGLYRAASLISP